MMRALQRSARRHAGADFADQTMQQIDFREMSPILDVRDVEKALRFYTEGLGFALDFRYARDPGNYAGVRRGNASLHMQWQAPELFEQGLAGRLRVRILVSDPDALLAEYRARGVLPESTQVVDTEWGTREFGFRDPDGNGLTFYCDR